MSSAVFGDALFGSAVFGDSGGGGSGYVVDSYGSLADYHSAIESVADTNYTQTIIAAGKIIFIHKGE